MNWKIAMTALMLALVSAPMTASKAGLDTEELQAYDLGSYIETDLGIAWDGATSTLYCTDGGLSFTIRSAAMADHVLVVTADNGDVLYRGLLGSQGPVARITAEARPVIALALQYAGLSTVVYMYNYCSELAGDARELVDFLADADLDATPDQLLLQVLELLPEDGEFKLCQADRMGPLAAGVGSTIKIDDLCRAVNSKQGNCEQNGDCTCGSQPQEQPSITNPDPARDLDEDGVIDENDDDDDCDHLADELEHLVGFNPTAASEDVFALNPFSGGVVSVAIAVRGIQNIADLDPAKDGHADVYIDTTAFGYRGKNSVEFTPWFPGLTHDDPMLDVGSSFRLDDLGSGLWGDFAKSVDYLGTLPSRFTDALYSWRDGDPVTGIPKVGFSFRVMDKDGATDDGKIGEVSTDDGISLLSMANIVQGTFWPTAFGYDAGSANVEVEVGVTASPCALDWAYLIANGRYNVDIGDLQRDAFSGC